MTNTYSRTWALIDRLRGDGAPLSREAADELQRLLVHLAAHRPPPKS